MTIELLKSAGTALSTATHWAGNNKIFTTALIGNVVLGGYIAHQRLKPRAIFKSEIDDGGHEFILRSSKPPADSNEDILWQIGDSVLGQARIYMGDKNKVHPDATLMLESRDKQREYVVWSRPI